MLEFSHIGVPVMDLDESIQFYSDVIGLSIDCKHELDHATLVFMSTKGTRIELIYKKTNEPRQNPSPIDHIAFRVDNLDVMYELIKELGYEISVEPTNVGNARIMFFFGPNKERIEFSEGDV